MLGSWAQVHAQRASLVKSERQSEVPSSHPAGSPSAWAARTAGKAQPAGRRAGDVSGESTRGARGLFESLGGHPQHSPEQPSPSPSLLMKWSDPLTRVPSTISLHALLASSRMMDDMTRRRCRDLLRERSVSCRRRQGAISQSRLSI